MLVIILGIMISLARSTPPHDLMPDMKNLYTLSKNLAGTIFYRADFIFFNEQGVTQTLLLPGCEQRLREMVKRKVQLL